MKRSRKFKVGQIVTFRGGESEFFAPHRLPVPEGTIGTIVHTDSPNVRYHRGWESANVIDTLLPTILGTPRTEGRFRAYDDELEVAT